ncbi:MAG: hypothetical protein F4226_03890, partial [Synechococcus sp. SB0678_bin_12]|nr:hypothetical protein [Synechococcus sp. SB0678_bin_12]
MLLQTLLPLAEALPASDPELVVEESHGLEIGQHFYWHLGQLDLHGQIFLSSWILIGALLSIVVAGTRRMERKPGGLQNLLEFLWDYIRNLSREQIGEAA